MTTVAIIQARMDSARLPGKVLADICGRPMLSHIIDRCWRIPGVDEVCVATTSRRCDVPICKTAADAEPMVYVTTMSHPDNVLGRVIDAADIMLADVVVRVCGDAPLFCPKHVGRLLQRLNGFDFLDPGPPSAYQGADVLTFEALLSIGYLAGNDPLATEHVTAWAYRHREAFEVGPALLVESSMLGEFHLSVDTERDLEYVRGIYRRHWKPGRIVDLEEVVKCM